MSLYYMEIDVLLKSLIIKYDRDTIIEKFSSMSKICFFQNKIFLESYFYYNGKSVNINLIPNNISKIIYLIMIHGASSENKEIILKDLLVIYCRYCEFDSNYELSELQSIDKRKEVESKYLFGLTLEQFWYQSLNLKEEINRNIEIQEKIAKCDLEEHYQAIMLKEVGVTFTEFRKICSQLLVLTKESVRINISNLNEHKTDESYKMLRVIKYLSGDISFYKKSPLINKSLFIKPFIKVSENEVILVDVYLLARKIFEGPYWVIRNYYLNNGNKTFPSKYGEYFEKYMNNLLDYYLKTNEYERIEEKKEKRADWVIFTERFDIIVEQKSSIIRQLLKKPFPDMEKLKDYLENYTNALKQLKETESVYKKDKIIIKIVVNYENMQIENFLRQMIFESEDVKELCIGDPENYIFTDISTFEILIQLLSDKKEDFFKIIERKILLEKNKDYSEGRDINQIIKKIIGVVENSYALNIINYPNYFKN